MKILTTRQYSQLLDKIKDLEADNRQLKDENDFLHKEINDKKTSYQLNSGKEFCFICKNSYKYTTYWGTTEYEKASCLLNIPCEDFERKYKSDGN